MANSAGRQARRNSSSFANKKQVKRVGAREVGQCLNDNGFLGLNVDIALASRPDGHKIARDAPNIAINKIENKSKKIPCI